MKPIKNLLNAFIYNAEKRSDLNILKFFNIMHEGLIFAAKFGDVP